MPEDKDFELPELPFHSPDELKTELDLYVCPRCGKEDIVPGFVADELLTGVACPRCDFKMQYKYSFYR